MSLTSFVFVYQEAEGVPVEVKVRSKGDGLYQCSYTPASSLKHTVSITWGGVSIPNSPFRVSSQSQRPVNAGRAITLLTFKNLVETESTSVVSSERLFRAETISVVGSERFVQQDCLKISSSGPKKKKPLIIITYTEERFSY